MKASDAEKLMLAMLCDMHQATAKKGEIDSAFVKKALFYDHLWAISWEYGGIPFEDRDDPPEVKQTVDILDMWSIMRFSFLKLQQHEKDEIVNKSGLVDENFDFPGFDGNNEGRHMSIAQFLVKEMNRWTEFNHQRFNSHRRLLSQYTDMRSKFEINRQSKHLLASPQLTKDEILHILA